MLLKIYLPLIFYVFWRTHFFNKMFYTITSDDLYLILASIASCNSKCNNTDTQLCCDGRTMTERGHEHIHCCGTESYNSLKYICCNEKLQKRKNNLLCCGGKNFFDNSEKACCSGTLNKRSKKGAGDACCGKEMYNTKYKLCCDGKIISTDLNINISHYCGKDVYNTLTHMCCGTTVNKIKSGYD